MTFISTINEVLFLGATYEQFPTATGYTTAAGTFRPGTVRMAIQGPLTITLPRKISYPEILAISFSIITPTTPATGWRGTNLITFKEDGVARAAIHAYDDAHSIAAATRLDFVTYNGAGQKMDKFGSTDPADIYFFTFTTPSFRDRARDVPTPGSLNRFRCGLRWDVTPGGGNNLNCAFEKWGYIINGGGGNTGELGLIPGTGINSITLEGFNGALWSEIIVTAENIEPGFYDKGGHSLYLIDLPPNAAGSNNGFTGSYDTLDDVAPNLGFSGGDSVQTSVAGAIGSYAAANVPHPYGIVTNEGEPGAVWSNGYEGVEDGYTWTWECYGVQVGAAGQTESLGEFSSTPSGPANLKVGVVTNGGSSFSDAVTMPTYSPGAPFAYGEVFKTWETNPVTGQDWTLEELNALELAVKAET